MAIDLKKQYKELYLPSQEPGLIEVPRCNYLAVEGQGDPNEADGPYAKAISVLYSVAYTLKMSAKTSYKIPDFFDYVVPPLEGFWSQDGAELDLSRKEDFHWISVIRLPDFIRPEDVDWAKEEAGRKKKLDCSALGFLTVEEGLCVQLLHLGPYDTEPQSVAKMDAFLLEQGYEKDFGPGRLHHEIYLSDPRRVAPEKRKTVLRHPVRKI